MVPEWAGEARLFGPKSPRQLEAVCVRLGCCRLRRARRAANDGHVAC